MFSVTRETPFPPEPGLEVGLGRVDAVPGTPLEVATGTTILEAAGLVGSFVPVLCYDERQDPFGACRVCLVGVEGAPGPLPSCTTPWARCW